MVHFNVTKSIYNMTILTVREYLKPYGCQAMDYKEARQLASKTATWFFQNNLAQVSGLPFVKESDIKPKMSDAMWAKLMTEAILSFHEGLELDPEGRRASNESYLYDSAIDFVGSDAFRDIAFIVSAAGTRRPIEQEIEQSFETIQQQPGGEARGFSGPEGLAGLIATDADAKAYGSASTIIMQIESAPPEQGLYHQSAQQLQQISKTQGLSQPFARALASLGAEYMAMADELTRQSGEGQVPGGAGPGVSGLPTGVHIGHRLRLIALRKRIIKEAKEAA